MSSTTLEKSSKKTKESKKTPLSYADALDVIQLCDVAIKEAAANRIGRPEDVVDRLQLRNLAKTAGVSFLMFAAGGASDMMDILEPTIAGTVAFGGMLGVFCGGIRIASTEKGTKALSPWKYRTLNQKVKVDMALFDLKEEEFADVERKVLKKATKAMKVINKNISFDNREITYSNIRGKEGFDIIQTKKLSAIESEKLRLQKMEMDSLKALQQPPSLTALGAGTLAGIKSRD